MASSTEQEQPFSIWTRLWLISCLFYVLELTGVWFTGCYSNDRQVISVPDSAPLAEIDFTIDFTIDLTDDLSFAEAIRTEVRQWKHFSSSILIDKDNLYMNLSPKHSTTHSTNGMLLTCRCRLLRPHVLPWKMLDMDCFETLDSTCSFVSTELEAFFERLVDREKRLQKQLEALDQSHPNRVPIYWQLGVIQAQEGAYNQAMNFYNKALDIQDI